MQVSGLDRLPSHKRQELERVARILFDEFEDAQKGKLSDKHKNGRILKLILFGSYARGDWVEDRKSGYTPSDQTTRESGNRVLET